MPLPPAIEKQAHIYQQGGEAKRPDLQCSSRPGLSLPSLPTIAPQVLVKPQGAKEAPMDLLVMENIFYEGHLAPIYDLKGSERARLAREDPRDPACVLLDQNLANSNVHSPLLVSPLLIKTSMELSTATTCTCSWGAGRFTADASSHGKHVHMDRLSGTVQAHQGADVGRRLRTGRGQRA